MDELFLDYFNLREDPFGVTPDPNYLYAGEMHREALASLIYCIEAGRGFVALVGPAGVGKTTLLYNVLERFSHSGRTALIFQTQCGSRDFMQYLMTDLMQDVAHGTDVAELNQKFNELLLQEALSNRRVLVVIDEAQNLSEDVLETVRLLSNFETSRAKLLQIILAGQEKLATKLTSPKLVQLRQRLSMVVKLHPLDRSEASNYIDHRLRTAGYAGPDLFSPQARELLITASGGTPRNINTLCFNALSLAFALQTKLVDENVMIEVMRDLRIDDDDAAESADDRVEEVTRRPVSRPISWPSTPDTSLSQMRLTLNNASTTTLYRPPIVPDVPKAAVESQSRDVVPPATSAGESARTAQAVAREPAATSIGNAHRPERTKSVPDQAHTDEANTGNASAPAQSRASRQEREQSSAPKQSPARQEQTANRTTRSTALPKVAVERLARSHARSGFVSNRAVLGTATALVLVATVGFGVIRYTGNKLSSSAPVAGATGASAAQSRGDSSPAETQTAAPDAVTLATPKGVESRTGSADAGGRARLKPPRVRNTAADNSGLGLPNSARTSTPQMDDRGNQPDYRATQPSISNDTSAPASTTSATTQGGVGGTMASLPTYSVSTPNIGPDATANAATGNSYAARNSDTSVRTESSTTLPASQPPEPVVAPPSVVEPAVPIEHPSPKYPVLAKQNRITGKVVLDVTVGADGRIRQHRVVSGSPLLAKAAVEAVNQWVYKPSLAGGKPVQTSLRLEFDFKNPTAQ